MTLQQKLNYYGKQKEPFLFVIDFDLKNYDIIKLKDLPKENIHYEIQNRTQNTHTINLQTNYCDFAQYKERFDTVQNNIKQGNTYLFNLTEKTSITSSYTLQEIYQKANGKFKLYYKDKFICFSPERFCKIEQNKIYTYPMKGTIDASIENASKIILEDLKELAEHTMVVDLLRNDLSIVSQNVKVEKFRYIDKISAGDKKLLQVSSKISGNLAPNWHETIGDILISLLPAGSITGTPKRKTTELIKEIENYHRGYFTGVFGVFDGETLDSAVMIRFIEKDENGNLVYKSGGGITCDSIAKKEYNEMKDKVYVP